MKWDFCFVFLIEFFNLVYPLRNQFATAFIMSFKFWNLFWICSKVFEEFLQVGAGLTPTSVYVDTFLTEIVNCCNKSKYKKIIS